MAEQERWNRETLPHLVTIGAGFWLFESPCTQALWEAVMETNPSHFRDGGGSLPVESVSWEDCREFLGRLNGRFAGLGLSLPTEAQWEYACRAGTTGARYGEPVGEVAWYSENSGGKTHRVGGKRPNAWGLYDMLGNVWEWCADAWRGGYGEPAPSASATARRVIRGGSWGNAARDVRAANRLHGDPSVRRGHLGFRCAEFREGVVSEERSEPVERGTRPRSGQETARRRSPWRRA